MKILITTERIHPEKGGVSIVLDLLGRLFTERGDSVAVLMFDRPETVEFPYGPVFSLKKQPAEAMKLIQGADIILQNNIALKTLLPILAQGRTPAVVLHSWLPLTGKPRLAWPTYLKIPLLRRCVVGSPNVDVFTSLGLSGHFVPNTYDADLFHPPAEGPRKGLLFVGRLIADKGVEELVEAHNRLTPAERELLPLTIVGDSDDDEYITRVKALSSPEVTFTGPKGPAEIARIMQAHTMLAVPSTGSENFPLVVLEGLATGLVPVGTDHSGIVRGMGEFGTAVHRGPHLVDELHAAMKEHIAAGCPTLDPTRGPLAEHLADYSTDAVLRAYDGMFAELRR